MKKIALFLALVFWASPAFSGTTKLITLPSGVGTSGLETSGGTINGNLAVTGTSTVTGTTTLTGGATIGESLGPETLTQTCAGLGLTTPVGAWSCSGDTITRTASASNLTLAIGPAVTVGTTYKASVTYATITAGTFSLSVGGLAQVTHGTAGAFPEYFPAVGATTAPTITVVAASAGTITLSSLSVRAKTDAILSGGGPIEFSKAMTSTANERVVCITMSGTAASGQKSGLLIKDNGSGGTRLGIDYRVNDVSTLSMDNTGALRVGNDAITALGTVVIRGGSNNNKGALIEFQKAGANAGFMGNQSAIQGGTSDGLTMYSVGNILFTTTSTTLLTLDTVRAAFAKKINSTVQSVTCTDNAGGTNQALTITPSSSYVEITNADPTGCDITMSETGAAVGDVVTLCVVGVVAAEKVNFSDTAGVTELAGAFAADNNDCIILRYGNPTTWREVGRSAN